MRRIGFALSLVSLACASSLFAATPINLRHQSIPLFSPTFAGSNISFSQTSKNVDLKQTTHIRIQQNYLGYPVWGAEGVIHVPKGGKTTLTGEMSPSTSMNGTVYRDLEGDLAKTPSFVFTPAQGEKALQHAANLFQKKMGQMQMDLQHATKNLIVYIDQDHKAHWAFLIKFIAQDAKEGLSVPTYILNATSFEIYESWNDAQTLTEVRGGGFGGNPKMGKLVYDGKNGDYPVLKMQRDAIKKLCYLQNPDVVVLDGNHKKGPFADAEVSQFKCPNQDTQHNMVFWSGDIDTVNQGYSPANDALYIGQVIKEMYQAWYNIPVLKQFGLPMKLKMNVHAKDFAGKAMDNAMFLSLNSQMYFGDGVSMFYPLTSLGVGAHEISHGFTAQHSNLTYQKQSGGLNESFSDMAAQAAEFYSLGKNSWEIGPEIVKGSGALRYMDEPTKDGRSISHMKNYNDSLNVHLTSGIFNKVFYLIGTANGWDTKKAFDVMVKANMDYWTANTTFAEAACGVLSATHDYGYDVSAVTKAMQTVGVDISHC